jgi:NADPH-dependent ferric siderophore reductase
MLTSESTVLEPDTRPAYRPFRSTVTRVRRLSSHFLRVTFSSDDFGTFGTSGLDQRVNLIFPLPGIGLSDCGWDDEQPLADGHWFGRWRGLPNETRNPLRVYTVRAIRPAERELDIDFVVHGDGPAARWLATAAPGDEIIIVGPDALSVNAGLGIDWHPGDAHDLLLVGDETAAPAIAGILEALPDDRAAHALIEVPSDGDAPHIAHSDRVRVTWLPRNGGQPGSALVPAVQQWVEARPHLVSTTLAASPQTVDESPDPNALVWDVPAAPTGANLYAWVAGEASTIKTIRRYLVRDVGIDRGQVAFMGYWRRGKAND